MTSFDETSSRSSPNAESKQQPQQQPQPQQLQQQQQQQPAQQSQQQQQQQHQTRHRRSASSEVNHQPSIVRAMSLRSTPSRRPANIQSLQRTVLQTVFSYLSEEELEQKVGAVLAIRQFSVSVLDRRQRAHSGRTRLARLARVGLRSGGRKRFAAPRARVTRRSRDDDTLFIGFVEQQLVALVGTAVSALGRNNGLVVVVVVHCGRLFGVAFARDRRFVRRRCAALADAFSKCVCAFFFFRHTMTLKTCVLNSST
jgi:hypothetical protein